MPWKWAKLVQNDPQSSALRVVLCLKMPEMRKPGDKKNFNTLFSPLNNKRLDRKTIEAIRQTKTAFLRRSKTGPLWVLQHKLRKFNVWNNWVLFRSIKGCNFLDEGSKKNAGKSVQSFHSFYLRHVIFRTKRLSSKIRQLEAYLVIRRTRVGKYMYQCWGKNICGLILWSWVSSIFASVMESMN